MGSNHLTAVDGQSHSRVALLNIGQEDIKGNETVKRAAELLRASQVNFVGYAEGNDIYTGDFDVVVCDGFVGNVALKTSEGAAHLVWHLARQQLLGTWTGRLAGLIALPALRVLRRRLDPRRYNGATFIGLAGTVIKSHGAADALAFEHAILEAKSEVQNRVPERIGRELGEMLSAGQVA